jgi:hypothetical protein
MMKLNCVARHLCALSDVPIPIKLPDDKSDTSLSAPDEPKHICEHCHKPMHAICGHNFTDVLDSLDKNPQHANDQSYRNHLPPMLPQPTSCLYIKKQKQGNMKKTEGQQSSINQSIL